MYIYQGKIINKPLYIHFLCGNKYKKKSDCDKRNVLKKYIDGLDNNYALILERLFEPKEYSKMGFKDLEEVELMASHYARSIIIFQETVSTAAEVALFGSKQELNNKVFVIYAPKKQVVLDTVGNFIKLAYFANDKVKNTSHDFFKNKVILRDEIGYYETFFDNNQLDSVFIDKLNLFWSNINDNSDIFLRKKVLVCNYQNTYEIIEDKINVILSYPFILGFVICILLNNSLIREKREKDECVANICLFFKEVMKSTVEKEEVRNLSNYNVSIKTIDKEDINLPVRFCIYLLERANFISFIDASLSISNDFKNKFFEYKDLIKLESEQCFFEGESDEDDK